MRALLASLIFFLMLGFSFVSHAAESRLSTSDSEWSIRQFSIDIAQDDIFGEILEPEEFSALVRYSMQLYLENEGIRLSEKDAVESYLEVVVTASYYRHLSRKASVQVEDRKAVNVNYWDPKFSYVVALVKNKKIIAGRRLSDVDLPNSNVGYKGSDLLVKDKNFAVSLGQMMAYSAVAAFGEKSEGRPYDTEVLIDKVDRFTEKFSEPLGVTQSYYIPIEVSAQYLSQMQSSDKGQRIDAYKNIQSDWVNNRALSDHLAEFVVNNYQTVGWGETTEVREAMRALACSGDLQYAPLFEQVLSDPKSYRAVQNDAEDSLYLLRKRAYLNTKVNQVITLKQPDQWKRAQLLQRLVTLDPKTTKLAIEELYRDYRFDSTTQELLVKLLKSYTQRLVKSYKVDVNEDSFAWALRILGESGNPEYLDLMKTIEKGNSSRKLKRYAKKYRKALEP